MLRSDWRLWRFWAVEHRSPLTPLRALRVEVVDIMSSAFVFLWVYSFLGVLQALLMIAFSSIIVFLFLRFTRSWCMLLRTATSRVLRYIVNLLFTIVLSAESCQSTRRLIIGSVFLFEYSASA